MTLSILCPACGHRLQVAESSAGGVATCPMCRGLVPLPAAASAPPPLAENPFASPMTVSGPFRGATDGDDGAVTVGIRRVLGDTRPWVRFVAVMYFICGGIMVLAVFGMLAFALTARGNQFDALPRSLALVLVVVYGVGAGLMIWLGVYLNGFASRITDVLLAPTLARLAAAMHAQRRYWTLSGVLAAIGLAFWLLSLAIGSRVDRF